MKIFYIIFIFLPNIHGKLQDDEKTELCDNLDCDDSIDEKVCGVRYEGDEVKFKMFDNLCKVLKFGCKINDSLTYGITNLKHCRGQFTQNSSIELVEFVNDCPNCTNVDTDPVCGIRQDGSGFRIRTFQNECQLLKYNCFNEFNFTITDFYICSNDEDAESEIPNEEVPEETDKEKIDKIKHIVVVDGSFLDKRNINESIENFFANTHNLDLPLREVQQNLNESTRRKIVKIFGPVKVYKPWTTVPKNVTTGDWHYSPTLNSCFHRCPTKCPEYYAPVCGFPGTNVREPALMFKNHCFMDYAQCKMYHDNKSQTALTSVYIEYEFMFCLGEQMSAVHRFLPVIKTLQHMGRLKTKGHYRYKMKNFRFYNQMSGPNPRIMG